MMTLRAGFDPSLLASSILGAAATVVAAAYWLIYSYGTEDLERARAAYDQISWVELAEPDWRQEYARRLERLKTDSRFFVADTPQDAASEFQGKLRQALASAGASIDSLQSSTSAPVEGKLPMIRAVATARIAAARVIDVLRSVEAIEPGIAVESLDIAIQSTGSAQAPERTAIMTITARGYVMIKSDAIN